MEETGVIDRSVETATSSEFMSAPRINSAAVHLNCIEHPVSKLDTLAGIAIKYGVEVADIRRMNGLVTDHQMFAFKTLQIPLPGKHPPSPVLPNGSAESSDNNRQKQTETRFSPIDLLHSFQPFRLNSPEQRVSSAMSRLQGYYGLIPSNDIKKQEGTGMAMYRKETADCPLNHVSAPLESSPPGHHRSRSFGNGFSLENGSLNLDLLSEAAELETDKSNEFSIRRRQKANTDSPSSAPKMIIKDENSSSGFSGKTVNGLAQRPKSASRYNQTSEADGCSLNLSGDSLLSGFHAVRKSSSASNLHASDNGSSIWLSTKWSLRSDLQALSTTTITKPIFDGLPKPIGKRNKAALD